MISVPAEFVWIYFASTVMWLFVVRYIRANYLRVLSVKDKKIAGAVADIEKLETKVENIERLHNIYRQMRDHEVAEKNMKIAGWERAYNDLVSAGDKTLAQVMVEVEKVNALGFVKRTVVNNPNFEYYVMDRGALEFSIDDSPPSLDKKINTETRTADMRTLRLGVTMHVPPESYKDQDIEKQPLRGIIIAHGAMLFYESMKKFREMD